MGQNQIALEYLDQAATEFLHLGDEVGWARTRIGWISSAAWLGHTEEALKEADRAREVFLHAGEYSRAYTVDNNVAVIYTRLARYQEALTIYERLRATYPTLIDQSETYIKRSIAMAESNQAANLFFLGDFTQARHLLQQALAKFMALGEPRSVIYTEMNLAEYDYAQGYYGSALRRYYAARDSVIQNNVDDPVLLAELKLFITECLVKLNRAEEACQLVSEAVKTYRESGMSLDTAEALCTYATALKASGRFREALAALDEASQLYDRGAFDNYAFRTRLQQAELLLEMDSFVEAYNSARVLKQHFETKGLMPRSVQATLVMVNALLENAQSTRVSQEREQQLLLLKEAMTLCRQAALQAHRHNLQESVYKSQYLLGRIAALQENPVKAARHYSAAIIQIERILNDLVSDLSPSFLHTAWTVYADMIALCLQQGNAEHAFSYLEQARSVALRQYLNKSNFSRSGSAPEENDMAVPAAHTNNAVMLRIQHELKDWQERYHNYSTLLEDINPSISSSIKRELIETEIRQCEAKINELFERLSLHQSERLLAIPAKKRPKRETQQSIFSQLRQALVPGQLMLAYFLYQGKLIIFALTAERLYTYENPGGVEQLERLLPLLHAHLQPGGWPNIDSPPQYVICRLLNKLYDLLIAPVEAQLPPQSGYLTIIPYGPLHELPFHALYNGSRFLIEDFQVHYLPASNMLTQLKTQRDDSFSPGMLAAHPKAQMRRKADIRGHPWYLVIRQMVTCNVLSKKQKHWLPY